MDYEADYHFVVGVYEALYQPGQVFLSADILALLRKQPQLLKINAGIPRDEGYRKAIEQEQSLQ